METQTSAPLLVGTWNARNLLTVVELAEWARVHPKTVYRWIREGRLEAIQFGPRTFRVPEVTCPPKPGPVYKLGSGQKIGYSSGKAGEECQRKHLQPNKSSAS